ncbi:MAG: NUDIX domain-containing protein [Chloroflexales bacterium]|nr:NUDIX domain-containing protein [Chloroflexales bacterium]
MNNRVLDLAYNLALQVRAVQRFIVRPTEIGVRVLLIKNDTVALVRHRGGRYPWGLPGGGIKMRESLADAARREALEETGCPVCIEHLHGVFYDYKLGFRNYTIVFVCVPQGELQPPLNDIEIATALYVPLRALPANTDPGSRRRIDEYLRGESGLSREWA